MNERRAGAVVDGAARLDQHTPRRRHVRLSIHDRGLLSIIRTDRRDGTAHARSHADPSVHHTPRLVGRVAHRAAAANAVDRDHAGHRGHLPRLDALGRLRPVAGADCARRRRADAGRHEPAERRRLYRAWRRDRRPRGAPARDGQRLAHARARSSARSSPRLRSTLLAGAAARDPRRLAHRRHRRSPRSPPPGRTWAAAGRLRTRRSAS